MKSWKKPTNEMIDKTLASLKKMTARKYFFSRLENPLWIKPLAERGYFKYPPKAQSFDDGTIEFPYWPEIQYLKNVCNDVPDEVINLVMDIPQINNPIVYDGILDIALQLRGAQSAKLKDKMLEYAGMEHQLRTHKYADLLKHWITEKQTAAAVELAQRLVAFAPDPQSEEKRKRRKENPTEWNLLHPTPRVAPWEYRAIMSEGVRPLAEIAPYQVVHLLINTTANLIRLRMHSDEPNNTQDFSNIWWPRLQASDDDSEISEKVLVHTLTFACEQVFEKSPTQVANLDKVLRKQRWGVFERLRQHLYAKYPNEQTKPWIRESILTYDSYHLWEYRYEFQQMIRRACEHFKEALLTKKERAKIFTAILTGPSKEDYQVWVVGWAGEEFTEERFQERQRRFHRMQFTPFAPVLFGKYATDFKALESKTEGPISDEDYAPFKTKVGAEGYRSPRSAEALGKLTDKDLLAYINKWDAKYYEGDGFTEINMEALASAFQAVFKEWIIPDNNRLRFWLENREHIERPIYVRAMIQAMQTEVKTKNLDNLNEYLTFCEWVLTHPDQAPKGDYRRPDESRENPNWSYARRAVCDFLGICLEKDVDVPLTCRTQLAYLLEMLCTQYDWHLDEKQPVILNPNSPISESINNTRSRALGELLKLGAWLRLREPDAEVPEITAILEKRFGKKNEYPLTLPEYAILGAYYSNLLNFNEAWTLQHKSRFFPQDALPAWWAAFEGFIVYNDPFTSTFEILLDDFEFAIQHLVKCKSGRYAGQNALKALRHHLFTYYLWDLYPLKGNGSLLERYYQQTNEDREHWANLFKDIGHRLWNSKKDLDQNLTKRIRKFCEWRLGMEEPIELKHFTTWLQAECLDAEWRLNVYAKVLDICKVEDSGFHIKTLCEMLPNHTDKVIECFFKLTEKSRGAQLYIQTEEAKAILKTGLASSDKDVRCKAKRALDNLLKSSRFDLLDITPV